MENSTGLCRANKELEVVLEEIRRAEDNPSGMLMRNPSYGRSNPYKTGDWDKG
jgi:hypothetical protein